MKNIIEMFRSALLALKPEDIDRPLTADEVVHIARELGAFWTYDYEAAAQGRPGRHAKLKSKLHSDGFFVSKILLEPENIRKIMARQMVMRISAVIELEKIDYVAGIPDGATKLGEEIAAILDTRVAKMEKRDGRIYLLTPIAAGKRVLAVEDFCTRATGFKEGVIEIKSKCPYAVILPFNPVIINRGGLKRFTVEGEGWFDVLPVVEKRINDWDAADCPLCNEYHSVPIRPKETDENWRILVESQK